jgi:methyl-accepting chemotaxis protein
MKKLLPFQMSENPSNELEQFLDFIAETNHIVDMANQWCTDTENETQDILHAIEIGNLSYQQNAKLAKKLREIRQWRREAKDTIEKYRAIVDWVESNSKTINQLQSVLGATRKAEKAVANRSYRQRTNILKETIGVEKYDGCI